MRVGAARDGLPRLMRSMMQPRRSRRGLMRGQGHCSSSPASASRSKLETPSEEPGLGIVPLPPPQLAPPILLLFSLVSARVSFELPLSSPSASAPSLVPSWTRSTTSAPWTPSSALSASMTDRNSSHSDSTRCSSGLANGKAQRRKWGRSDARPAPRGELLSFRCRSLCRMGPPSRPWQDSSIIPSYCRLC